MPSKLFAIEENFPTFTGAESLVEQIRLLHNYMFQLKDSLQYSLRNLTADNFNSAALDQLTKDAQGTLGDELKKLMDLVNDVSAELNKVKVRVNHAEAAVGRITGVEADIEAVKEAIQGEGGIWERINDLQDKIENGEFDGEDGHTPVKGVDYWTDADKKEIVDGAAAGVLGGTWIFTLPDGSTVTAILSGVKPENPEEPDISLLPAEYQQVEYIATDGNQCIDTDVIPSDYTDGIYYELDFCAEPAGSNNTDYLFGCLSEESLSGGIGVNFYQGNLRSLAGSTNSAILYNWYNVRKRCVARMFATSENPSDINLSFERDGTETTVTPVSSNFESKPMPSESIYLFNCRGISRTSCAVTCWGFKMTAADSTPIRNFVPCYRKSDNAIGLYDTVEGKFYTNTGTGSFTKGADV